MLSSLALLSLPFLLLYGGAIWPQSQVYGATITHGPRDTPLVALTFDDGPTDPPTTQVLNTLAHYGVKATFFLVGSNVEAYPETARRIAREGHSIGNHSYRHYRLDALTDFYYRDVARAQQVLRAIIGVEPRLYRSPYGLHTPWQLAAVRRLGLQTVVWDVNAYDWVRTTSEVIIARRVMAHVRPGSIILLHDGDHNRHSDRNPTVQALPHIIELLQDRGYRFVTVPELLSI